MSARKATSGDRRNAPESRKPKVDKRQLDLPAGYLADGTKLASLKDILDPKTPTMSLAELNDKQRVDLVAKRLQMQPENFKIAMLGAGVIDKARAIAEVRAQSPIGRQLMEIEQRLIQHLTTTSMQQEEEK